MTRRQHLRDGDTAATEAVASPDALHAIAREWTRLARAPELLRRYRTWQAKEPELGRFVDPVAVVGFMRGDAPAAEKDAVLLALMAWARFDPWGGQVVLEVIRPGLLNLLRRVASDHRDREELRARVLLAVWEGVRRYPLERRPRRVAANLLLDTLHRTLVQVGTDSTWRATHSLVAHDRSGQVAAEVAGDVDDLLDRAVRAGALSTVEAEVILASRIDGVELARLAREAGVSYNTLKVRRQRAERRLLLYLGFRPVPRGQQTRPSSFARVAGARSEDLAG